ncbi:hypothetical protein LTR62_003240 [Meristemomyces frigidus]|uniref:Cutinase n=1 Tax=Meristemomyces frigidus TaxID=1508187 RepID=A0AAN7YKM6_9PEZI|nr:hypothetical protein LTR62_003240 [Meristemomyces frigidus]
MPSSATISFSSFLASLLATFCFPVVTNAQDPCAVCDDVHFMLARGNNEPYPGRQAALVEATCDGLASCGYENIYYSALYTDLYCQTAYDGAIAGSVQITAYAEKCPHSKIILAGYSQGGQIASDILGGGGGYSFNGCFQPYTPAIDRSTSPGNQIAAVMIFGDTRHTANQTYNYGNGSSLDGWFPRNTTQLANLDAYAPIMRNWCVSSDPVCAANQTSYNEASHLDYFDIDSGMAASFIKSVASLTETDTAFTTAIPTSLSGTVQNYATIGTATPSGSVSLDTTWTSSTSYPACTATSYSRAVATTNATMTGSTASTSSASGGSVTASVASVFPVTASSAANAVATPNATVSGKTGTATSGAVAFVGMDGVRYSLAAGMIATFVLALAL